MLNSIQPILSKEILITQFLFIVHSVTSKDGSTIVEIETKSSAPRKKRRKKRKRTQRKKKISRIDPEDLPKRARWTIIITAGLLILTCMFLVGITLRMAPVIDQMGKFQLQSRALLEYSSR